MLDKVKLKDGLAWNCMDNEIIGFIAEDLNTTKLFEKNTGCYLKCKRQEETVSCICEPMEI